MPCARVLADAAYGSDSRLRRMLDDRGEAYVLAVRSNECLRFVTDDWHFMQTDPSVMAGELDPAEWAMHPAGEDSKGLRPYDWARIALLWTRPPGFERWVLIRRNRHAPDQHAYYLAFAPKDTTLAELAGGAGLRWTIKECFQRTKNDLGLDHCEARSWHGWNRHTSLVMAAAAFVAKLSADLRRSTWSKPNETRPAPSIAACSPWRPSSRQPRKSAISWPNCSSGRRSPRDSSSPGHDDGGYTNSGPPKFITYAGNRNCSTSSHLGPQSNEGTSQSAVSYVVWQYKSERGSDDDQDRRRDRIDHWRPKY
jgi:hypothetical protein